MTIDIPTTVGKVTRKLDSVEREGRQAWRLTATRIYETNIEDAWDALSSRERIQRWFMPVSGELQLGGRYQLEGNAGGVIERCEPPHLLALTWEMHGDVSWVKVQLVEEAGTTRLTLEHLAHVPQAIFDQFGPGGMGVGWDLGLMALELHLQSDAPMDPKEADAWGATSEGRPFVEACSNSWAEASIKSGTDATKANEAASRVANFYSPR